MVKINKMKLGDLLLSVGKINEEQLKRALVKQRSTGEKIGEVLVDMGLVSELDIIEVLEFQLGIPHVNLSKYTINAEITNIVSEDFARKNILIPIEKYKNRLKVAMADPLNLFIIDDLKIISGLEIEPVISTRNDIFNSIDRYFGKQTAEKAIEDFKEQYKIEDIDNLDEEMLNEINNAPVVRLINSIIRQAIKAKASDIHIEPFENNVRVRFRIDGDLQEIMSPTKSTHSAIVTRIKIMGNMDIAEKRIPQDGRVEINIDGNDVDMRISVLPTVYGEKIVIRLLDRTTFLLSKEQLGFTQNNNDRFDNIINHNNGIILVTGPTGSGKTTTLYAVLRNLNTINKNIITVEDPVEYRLDGINQVQVNNKTGLTFAGGLRSILRQDPDIIMVGEIRDTETAQIAVRAALTGHLVISTLHTNDAPSTINRLVDMGIEPYLITASIVGIIAQRLVRKICDNCMTEYEASMEEKRILEIDANNKLILHRGKGCNNCYNSGYKGRIAIHEILPMTKGIREIINNRGTLDDIKDKSVEEGMTTLKKNCIQLVKNGITTVEEYTKIARNME